MLTALAWPAWPPALGFIDPDRPISWLVGQCQVIAALKIAAVEKDSATFEVVKVLQGQLKDRRITVRWTATQQPPVEKAAVDAPAVLLVPRDKEDPTLIQVSPEYLAVKPDKNKPGQYDYVRLNGFVKGSFNGQSADLLALLADTLAKRAYFPIWADTSFAPAAKIGQLPGGAALAIGDLDGDGGLDIVGATAKGLVAFSAGGQGKFVARPLPGVGPAARVQLADANGDGRLDVLTDAGLFLARGDGQYSPAEVPTGKDCTAAVFCHIPGQPIPAIIRIEAGRVRGYARAQGGTWADITAQFGLDKPPQHVQAVSACHVGLDRVSAAVVAPEVLICLDWTAGKPFRQSQSLPLLEKAGPPLKNAGLIGRDLDGDGLGDVFLACDGAGRLFQRLANGALAEVPDHLGDVRKMFGPVQDCAGLLCEDFNNDGLADLVAWSKTQKLLLAMNRGYHNLREGSEIFDLVGALKGLSEVTAAATADIDGDGDLDLLVADGKALYLLANTFENKPDQANDRPRNPLLTVRAPGRFGALVTIEDKDGKPISSQRLGDGPVADTVYFGYRAPIPAAVVMTTAAGQSFRQAVPAEAASRPVIFRDK